MHNIYITIPGTNQVLVIESKVLEIFREARQLSLTDKETGGILLALISEDEVRIVEASRSGKRASISRVMFKPNLRGKRILVKKAFAMGRHFVGEWHTHPEKDPTPSRLDEESMCDSFRRSKHELNAFLLIVVGNRVDQLSISVTQHGGYGVTPLGQFKIEI